jgi:uncharacterized protein YndB with AHSA1/START domain
MPSQEVVMDGDFAAPRAQVFAAFADHARFGRIMGGRFTRIRDAADPNDPNGLGSVRELRGLGPAFEETIVTYQPPSLIEYRVTRGSPIKNHLGRIEFSDAPGGGTRIHYVIRFDPRVPFTGSLIAGVLRGAWPKAVTRVMKNL